MRTTESKYINLSLDEDCADLLSLIASFARDVHNSFEDNEDSEDELQLKTPPFSIYNALKALGAASVLLDEPVPHDRIATTAISRKQLKFPRKQAGEWRQTTINSYFEK